MGTDVNQQLVAYIQQHKIKRLSEREGIVLPLRKPKGWGLH